MLANLLSLLDKNADLLWLAGLLLALAFRRNRFALTLAAIGAALWGPSAHPGVNLASALLVLLIAVVSESGLWSLRSMAVTTAAIALPFLPELAPSTIAVLDHYATQAVTGSLGLGWGSWLIVAAASF
ncbi:MAG TPA: hypothetical protein VN259_02655, partial [Xanthomonadales bacterium]|nr:hypothetical protein [Xanthomonadales bacterium]